MMIRRQTQKGFLRVPVRADSNLFRVTFRSGEGPGAEFLHLKIPAVSERERSDFTAEYPLPFFPGPTVVEAEESFFQYASFEDSPAMEKSPSPEDAGARPLCHFAPDRGWINDPNGLFYREGEWHLYCQYNPFSTQWENMHWLHASSTDLIHWREKGIVLYPDSTGTMYSGSAVVDEKGIAGFGKNAVLFYYTSSAYTGGGSVQGLAVSTDGGTRFKKYAGNPILPNFTGKCDRDPSIVFDPDAGIWRMVLYFGDEEKREFGLFESEDLLHWQKTDVYRMGPGRECPGLRRMRDGISGLWKWVFTEANGFFRVGTIEKGKIRFESAHRPFLSGDAYAGQFFFNAPNGRNLFLAWLRPHNNRSTRRCGAMTFPMEITLHGGLLRVRPAVQDIPMRPFEAGTRTVLRISEEEIVFDPALHEVRRGGDVWPIPVELDRLQGKYIVDPGASFEYFDDSGLFTLALSGSF